MKFEYCYRAADGQLISEEIDAESRLAALQALEARAVKVISIKPAPEKKMSFRVPVKKTLVILASVGAVCLVVKALLSFDWSSSPVEDEDATKKIQEVAAAQTVRPREETAAPTAHSIATEYAQTVKEFVKTKATNETQWLIKPLDPDDPDNALRTRITQELGALLSIEPGEQMPPFPFSFILEDELKAAANRGEEVGEAENGNKMFLDGLKKWKIVAKDTDSDNRLAHKEKLLQAQQELLAGIDEGLSVNDTIRAAYEFRTRAYAFRQEAISMFKEMAQEEGSSDADTLQMLDDMNVRFSEEGIKKITPEEIGFEEE